MKRVIFSVIFALFFVAGTSTLSFASVEQNQIQHTEKKSNDKGKKKKKACKESKEAGDKSCCKNGEAEKSCGGKK